MNKRIIRFIVAAAIIVLAVPTLKAAVSAYAFGDYYYVLSSPDEDQEKLNGFWLRRMYLTYDANISDKIKARARLEMASDGKFGTSQVALTPYVKDAYVSYSFHPLHAVTIGIQDSLNWSGIEKFYGYRHLEKTPFDLYKNRSSRDFGISLEGRFDSGKKIGYSLMYGNYSGYKSETDKYKQVSGRLTFNPNSNIMFEINGDLVTFSDSKKSSLLQAFLGYQGDWGRIGLNYGREMITEDDKEDVNFGVFSGFVVGKLSKEIEVIVRYDMTADPQVHGSDSYFLIQKGFKTNFFILGLGWNLHPKFQVMPNIKVVTYKENNGVKPDSFSQFNVTFYYVF